MSVINPGKALVRDFLNAVWNGESPASFEDFWAVDCVNHAATGGPAAGIEAIREYHEAFFAAFHAFADVHVEVLRQVEEGDTVVTHVRSRGRHVGEFSGIAPTGKVATLDAIRIDRIEGGKIAEHWSVTDLAGLLGQLQT